MCKYFDVFNIITYDTVLRILISICSMRIYVNTSWFLYKTWYPVTFVNLHISHFMVRTEEFAYVNKSS